MHPVPPEKNAFKDTLTATNSRILTPFTITIVVALLASFGPFSIDAYLPSFYALEESFSVSKIVIQQTITVYFVPFCVLILVHGALADSYGRRRILLLGLGGYTLGSIVCTLAPSIEVFYLGRFLQGSAIGAGMVIGRALIRDLFNDAYARRVSAQAMVLFAIAPAIAPVIGGWIQYLWGWRWIFAMLSIMSFSLAVFLWRYLPETLAPERRISFRFKALLSQYLLIMRSAQFWGYTLTFGLMFAAIFMYVLLSPEFIMTHNGLQETDFLWLFGPLTGGLMLGSYISRIWSHKRGYTVVYYGLIVSVSGALINLLINFLAPEGIVFYSLPLALITIGMGLATPPISIATLDLFPNLRGLASSAMSFVQMGCGVISSVLLGPLVASSLLYMAAMAMLLVLSAAIIFILMPKTHTTDFIGLG